MFRFPDGPQPISTPAPDLGDMARLVVELPHWSAGISVVDRNLRPVDGLSKVEQKGRGQEGASAIIQLAAGTYGIEARLGGNSQTHWVIALEGQETRVPVEMWDSLNLTTSMPIASPIDGTPADDPLVGTAHDRSRESRSAAASAPVTTGQAKLFLFGHLSRGSAQARSAWDIELNDETGASVARLLDEPPRVEESHWSCTLNLPAGYYVLRARELCGASPGVADTKCSGATALHRYQPLYLCAGWEGHVFLECDESPRLATMAFNMSRLGTGYRPDDEATIAAASVLSALGNGHARDTVAGASRMEELLRGEMHNPWLGVLAAYALTSGEKSVDAPDLLAEVVAFLKHEIGEHPDVRALAYETDQPGRLDYPPMLRAGLRNVRSAAAANSAFSRLGQRLVADSAWTAWIEREESASPARQPNGDPGIPAPIQVLSEALSSSAPIYPVNVAGGPSPAMTAKGFAQQVAIIAAAEQVISNVRENAASSVTVPSADAVDTLLNVGASQVSDLVGTDLETVEKGYRNLSKPLGKIETLDEDSARSLKQVLTTIFEVKRCDEISCTIEDGSAHAPADLFATRAEDHVATLRQEARRLRSLNDRSEAPTRRQRAKAAALAARLDDQAERLLTRAHLVIVTDEEGRLLFVNKLLHDRLQQRIDPQDVIDRMQRGLGSKPGEKFQLRARDLSPTSPEGLRDAMVDIRRTSVRDESGALQANIYLLRDASVKDLGLEATRALEAILPVMMLHAATAQYGNVDLSQSLEELQRLIEQVDECLR